MSFNAFLVIASVLHPVASGVSLPEARRAVREAQQSRPSGKPYFQPIQSHVRAPIKLDLARDRRFSNAIKQAEIDSLKR